jgi:hypothetical protein
VNPLQDRDAEREGLARSSPGLTNQVVAVQGDGERQGLDREGVDDALGLQRSADWLGDAEVAERFIAAPQRCDLRLWGLVLIFGRIRSQGFPPPSVARDRQANKARHPLSRECISLSCAAGTAAAQLTAAHSRRRSSALSPGR